jgi:HlyD family secretion protein
VRALIPVVLLGGLATWWFLSRPTPLPRNLIAVSGRIEGDDSAVATKPGGRVVEITVREGDSVKAGDLVAVIDDAQVRDREDQARHALQQAEAQVLVQRQQIPVLEQQLEQSRLALGQARLDTQGKIFQAQQQVVAADANILQAEARVRSARRQIAVQQQLLEQNRLGVDQSRLDSQGRVAQAEQQVAAAEATLAQLQAQHHQAEVDAKRYVLLANEDAVSVQTAEQYQTNEASLRAAMLAAQKQVEAARGALTTAQANLTNPAVRRSQEAATREQIRSAREDLSAAQAEVAQMRALRQQAAGNLTATRANLTNPAVRASQETAIREQIAQAQANIAAAQDTAKQARAKLAEAQADRKDLRVLAPFAGTVATRVAEPGEVLAPGATVITLVDLGKVYLRGYIPEGEIGRVKVGQEARIYLDSAPNKPVAAFVSRIDPEASFTPENTYFRNDRVLQVVGVKLQAREGIGFVKPGMPADGEVLVEGDWPAGRKR